MDLQDEIKRLRARVHELEIDSKAIFTGAVTHEIRTELAATKKRLAELEKQQQHAKG
jgi:hypothetical protein